MSVDAIVIMYKYTVVAAPAARRPAHRLTDSPTLQPPLSCMSDKSIPAPNSVPNSAPPATRDPWAELNDRQREAVDYGVGDDGTPGGPLLVIAGAGSGKTSTLAHRVANLIARGADPNRLLLLTFSRRAAGEMERRAAKSTRAGLVATAVAAMGGHVPRHRRAAVARLRNAYRALGSVHHS